ncbi:uncharacterized protein B0H18DRAFT_1082481 [Fomitopsis serialis]|uniref:uncharacterized protein n=1 Tax=Fomitopsis serialis TaxID=139415 RepID=UPI002008A461|nr:uncharacterized protein B0H18DRAFT_1082481 [Neoantrodia serialis]KAH9934674.1 hypothetical protein B0H18DRAFT_1082481 [Neoantrodia serialis]
MARKTRSQAAATGNANNATGSQKAPSQFPPISPKRRLQSRALLEDQIILVDGFMTPEECKRYVHFIDSQSLELTPPKKRGEAERVNYRMSVTSADMAEQFYTLFSPHLPPFPYPASLKRDGEEARPVHSFNSNIRMYKYTPGQHFGCHYDDSVRDPQNGAKSEWTLLVYLTGIEDGVKGGETIFYTGQKGKRGTEVITAPLTKGTASCIGTSCIYNPTQTRTHQRRLHRHGHECLLHEGSPVISGTKYILRSDLMFID